MGAVAAAVIAGGVLAWTQTAPHGASQVQATPQVAQPQAARLKVAQAQGGVPKVTTPKAEQIVLLVRNTLITLNNALRTGNFTVLRDMAAPGFRDANTAASLARAFSDLASRNIDLSAVSVITPQLIEQPALDRNTGLLRLKGYFPGRPARIDFELLYQPVDGHWRVFGLSVQPNSTQ